MLYWAIKKFSTDEYLGFKEFPNDQIIMYDGMFGVPRHFIWWAESWPAKPGTVGTQDQVTLMAFHSGKSEESFLDTFIIKNVTYDNTKKLYRVLGISAIFDKLEGDTGWPHHPIATASSPASAKEVIRKVLDSAFGDKYGLECPENSHVEYIQMSFDLDMNGPRSIGC
ncbi:MAG: hypothetical protein R6T93_10000 [Trueperaceae bacterium]